MRSRSILPRFDPPLAYKVHFVVVVGGGFRFVLVGAGDHFSFAIVILLFMFMQSHTSSHHYCQCQQFKHESINVLLLLLLLLLCREWKLFSNNIICRNKKKMTDKVKSTPCCERRTECHSCPHFQLIWTTFCSSAS